MCRKFSSPETLKQFLPLLTAYAEGKQIQINYGRPGHPDWTTDSPSWDLDVSCYRVKPEPVEVKKWIVITKHNHLVVASADSEHKARAWLGPGRALVEVTGSYER